MTKKLLNNIFHNYKSQYNLQTTLKFGNYNSCHFNYSSNIIFYDIEWVKCINVKGYTEGYGRKKICIFSLLHEIKHAIDYTINQTMLKKEISLIDNNRYCLDFNYSINLPFEQRANAFAKQEMEKRD